MRQIERQWNARLYIQAQQFNRIVHARRLCLHIYLDNMSYNVYFVHADVYLPPNHLPSALPFWCFHLAATALLSAIAMNGD